MCAESTTTPSGSLRPPPAIRAPRRAARGALDVPVPAEYSHSPSRRQDAQALHRYSPGGEYDGNEYGGLPAKYRILQQMNQSLLRPGPADAYAACMKMVI